MGRDWTLFGEIENVCCCNCISILIIMKKVIIDCVELFRYHGRETLSKISRLECIYHYDVSFVLWNETMLSILFPHIIQEMYCLKIASSCTIYITGRSPLFIQGINQPPYFPLGPLASIIYLENGQCIDVVFYHFEDGVRISIGIYAHSGIQIKVQ